MTSITGVHTLDHSISTLHDWLNDLNREMGFGDMEEAFVSMRSVLIALRDRLTVDEAADFAAQLPMLLQGVFYHGYKPGNKPIKMKTSQEFVNYVAKNLTRQIDPIKVIQSVFAVFKNRMTAGQIKGLSDTLPAEITSLWQ
ncbi:MAG: hypothetical protein BWY69_00020 [Planctomycetes bacterium ADurb.Bin401]|nr:MAG: hypothetical protein BWY69_00020 [Planctomycetes bacterium ADurb.Bin401]